MTKQQRNGKRPSHGGRKITPASEWRKAREGVVLDLPSGFTGRFRSVGFEQVILSESIPDVLTAVMDELINAKTDGEAQAIVERMTGALVQDGESPGLAQVREQARSKRAFLEAFCAPMFVEPRIVTTARADDEIEITDVSTPDLEFLFQWFGAPTSALIRFHDEQVAALESVGVTEGDAPPGE